MEACELCENGLPASPVTKPDTLPHNAFFQLIHPAPKNHSSFFPYSFRNPKLYPGRTIIIAIQAGEACMSVGKEGASSQGGGAPLGAGSADDEGLIPPLKILEVVFVA